MKTHLFFPLFIFRIHIILGMPELQCFICLETFEHTFEMDAEMVLNPTNEESQLKQHIRTIHFPGYNPPPVEHSAEAVIEFLIAVTQIHLEPHVKFTVLLHLHDMLQLYQ